MARPNALLPRRSAAATGALLVLAASRSPGARAFPLNCAARIQLPEAPLHATDLNGLALADVCFNTTGEHHVFVLGDWGGVEAGIGGVVPADRREPSFGAGHFREFVEGIDNRAQLKVAMQMQARASSSRPDYILNVGDNFYWGGIESHCGNPPYRRIESPGQWGPVFEHMYVGDGIEGKPWLSVLGNHDYGGYTFLNAWDQQIGYTWGGAGSSGRWVMPAQYWTVKVWYPGFAVDYYFIDSNVFATRPPLDDPSHNICSLENNPTPATCGPQGPQSVWDCPHWFGRLWDDQMAWIEKSLAESVADWQVVVTHFPPTWGNEDWLPLARRYGIDLIVTGHVHSQHVYGPEDPANFLRPTAFLVSGGGGGITSEGTPDRNGHDDEYGFFDIQLSKSVITIEAVSHGGVIRASVQVGQRHPDPHSYWMQRSHKRKVEGPGSEGSNDPEHLPRCDGTRCPPSWLLGEPGAGGYFCPASGGCRGATQGPFAKDLCPGQCFIGDPPVKSLSTTTTTRTTTTVTTTTVTAAPCAARATACPEDWSGGVGGYFCPRTSGCRPRSQGPWDFTDCPDQCSLGGHARVEPTPVPVDLPSSEDSRARAAQLLHTFQSEYRETPNRRRNRGGGVPRDRSGEAGAQGKETFVFPLEERFL